MKRPIIDSSSKYTGGHTHEKTQTFPVYDIEDDITEDEEMLAAEAEDIARGR